MSDEKWTDAQMLEFERAARSGALTRLFNNRPRPSWVNSVEIQQVVVVRSCWGAGLGPGEGVPVALETFREITEVFDMEGNLIARQEPCEGRWS